MADKQVFRITFQFTGKYSYVAASNIFLRCVDLEQAKRQGDEIFRAMLAQRGLNDADFTQETFQSSEEEAEEYRENMEARAVTHRTVN